MVPPNIISNDYENRIGGQEELIKKSENNIGIETHRQTFSFSQIRRLPEFGVVLGTNRAQVLQYNKGYIILAI